MLKISFFERINEKFMEGIKESQEMFLKPDYLRGDFLETPKKFFEDIYRTFMKDKNRRTFMVNKTFDKQFKCESIRVVKEKHSDFWFYTPSIFWHHRLRTKEELIWITSITLDFDFATDNSGRDFDAHEISSVLKNEFGYIPNYVWETRTSGNYQVNYLIKPMTGTVQSIYYYEAVAKRMALICGADVTAVNSNNLYCIPKKGTWRFSDKIHDIDDFSYVLEDEDIEKELGKMRNSNVVSFTEKQIMNSQAIKTLMNAEFDCYRNHAAFTIALLFYCLDKTEDKAFDFLSGEWFDKVNDGRIHGKKDPFRLSEVVSTVKSAYSGRYHGPSKEWIEFLSGYEFPFNLYKSTYIKQENGYQSGDEVAMKILDWIRENDGETIKGKDLCRKLEIPERSYYRVIKKLKNEGIIDFKTKRGRYSKGTTFDYIGTSFEAKLDTTVNASNLVDYFQEEEENA